VEPASNAVGSGIAKLPPIEELAKLQPRKPGRPDMRTCAVCGQRFDARDLSLLVHHDSEPHKPLIRKGWRED
jgi:hypothetical protein